MKNRHVISLLVGLVVLVASIRGDAEPIMVKVGTVQRITHPTCQSLAIFQKELSGMLENRMSIRIFPDAQLGTVPELLEGLQFGNIELGILPMEELVRFVPQLSVISMPYLFRDDGHRFRVLDGPIGLQLLDLLKTHNLIGLGFLDTGTANMVTKRRHIMKPDQMQGIKIGGWANCRPDNCPNLIARLSAASLTAQGAMMEPVSRAEIPEALQADRISGWEGNEPDCAALKLVETGAAYFTYTRRAAVPDILAASKVWFDALDPDAQQAIQRAAKLTVRQQRKLWDELVQMTIMELEAGGMKFETADRELFYKTIQPVYLKMYQELGPEFEAFVQAIQAVK